MKAAFPRGARAFRSERWLVKLATTMPCSGGSPPHLAPRVWGRRAGCAVSWSSGLPEGTRRDVSPAAVGAVGRASGYVLFRVRWFRRVLTRDLRGDSLGVCAIDAYSQCLSSVAKHAFCTEG